MSFFFFFWSLCLLNPPLLWALYHLTCLLNTLGHAEGHSGGQTRHILIGRRQMVNGIVVDATWDVNWVTRQCHWEGNRRGTLDRVVGGPL